MMETKIKDHIGPEEFGISAAEAEKARNYAAFLVNEEREACAQMCKDKAKAIGARADSWGDLDYAEELKALAWQLNVMGAEIRMRSN